MKIDLEFVRRRLPARVIAGWLALAAACGFAAWRADVHAARSEALQQALARRDALRLRATREPSSAVEPSANDPALEQRVARANGVIAALALPWDVLFSALEGADSRSLALLAVEPNARDSSVRISGEARSVAEVLAYAERLARQPGLSQVHLQGYEAAPRDGVQVFSFRIGGRWSVP